MLARRLGLLGAQLTLLEIRSERSRSSRHSVAVARLYAVIQAEPEELLLDGCGNGPGLSVELGLTDRPESRATAPTKANSDNGLGPKLRVDVAAAPLAKGYDWFTQLGLASTAATEVVPNVTEIQTGTWNMDALPIRRTNGLGTVAVKESRTEMFDIGSPRTLQPPTSMMIDSTPVIVGPAPIVGPRDQALRVIQERLHV